MVYYEGMETHNHVFHNEAQRMSGQTHSPDPGLMSQKGFHNMSIISCHKESPDFAEYWESISILAKEFNQSWNHFLEILKFELRTTEKLWESK